MLVKLAPQATSLETDLSSLCCGSCCDGWSGVWKLHDNILRWLVCDCAAALALVVD